MTRTLALILSFTVAIFLVACSGKGSTLATNFNCDTPRQQGDWTRVEGADAIGYWHEYINGEGKRFRSARLTVDDVQDSMANFFTGDASALVSAFDNLRLMLGEDVDNLNLVEMEFGTNSEKPSVSIVVDVLTATGEDRRGVMIRSGQNHVDMLQLSGAGVDAALLKTQLLAFSSGCTTVL